MEEQKKHIIEHVQNQKPQEQSVTVTLQDLGIKRSILFFLDRSEKGSTKGL